MIGPSRPLVLHILLPRTILWRIHRGRHDPLYFGRQSDPALRNRWDSEWCRYGVCYLAEKPEGAFVEGLLRQSRDAIAEADLESRAFARIEVLDDLHLADFSGKGIRSMGVTATDIYADYPATWKLSEATYAHPDEADGIAYRANHATDEIVYAIFDRARPKLQLVRTDALMAPASRAFLYACFDAFRVSIVPVR